jgi:hypothetical protein
MSALFLHVAISRVKMPALPEQPPKLGIEEDA